MQKLLGYMRKAIQEFDMISDGDVIAVGVSGGKDSLVLLNGLVLLRRFIGIDYRVVSITLDPQFGGIPGNYQPIAGGQSGPVCGECGEICVCRAKRQRHEFSCREPHCEGVWADC